MRPVAPPSRGPHTCFACLGKTSPLAHVQSPGWAAAGSTLGWGTEPGRSQGPSPGSPGQAGGWGGSLTLCPGWGARGRSFLLLWWGGGDRNKGASEPSHWQSGVPPLLRHGQDHALFQSGDALKARGGRGRFLGGWLRGLVSLLWHVKGCDPVSPPTQSTTPPPSPEWPHPGCQVLRLGKLTPHGGSARGEQTLSWILQPIPPPPNPARPHSQRWYQHRPPGAQPVPTAPPTLLHALGQQAGASPTSRDRCLDPAHPPCSTKPPWGRI